MQKQKKRKNNKKLPSNISKNDLDKQACYNISKDISTSKRNGNTRKRHDSTHTHTVQNVKRLELPTKNLNNDNITTKVPRKVQLNTDGKRKRKKRNKGQKQGIGPNQTNNNNVVEVTSVVKSIKESQKVAKKIMNCEQNKTKVQNLKIINQQKVNQTSNNKAQQVKSGKMLKLNNCKIKLGRLEEMLTKKMQTMQKIKKEQPLTLRDRMMAQLSASRFRYINETLYNSDSSQSKQYFKEDPDAFKAYHDGYKQQIEQWPVNPLDIIISSIKKMYYFLFLLFKKKYIITLCKHFQISIITGQQII